MADENVLNVDYNGVIVRSSRLIGWDREPVYQGPDFLYLRHRIHMVGTLHPKFNWLGVNADVSPSEQDKLLLKRLQTPRRKLEIRLGDAEQNAEPWISVELDQNHGPVVVASRLSAILGLNHMSHEVVIEFTQNLSPNVGKNHPFPPMILSNRWEMSEETDRHFRKRIIVRGRAIFRREQLELGGFLPDQFRKWILWPVVPGYRRVHRQVGTGINGVELFYQTIDEQTSVDILAKHIADLKVIHTYTHTQPSTEAVDKSLLVNTGSTLKTAAGKFFNLKEGGPFGTISELVSGSGRNLEIGYAALPRHVGHLVVWVKGTPHATMVQLASAASKLTLQRLATLPLACPGVTGQVVADFTAREVTLTTIHEAAPLQGNLAIAQSWWDLSNPAVSNVTSPFFAREIGVQGLTNTFHTTVIDVPGPGARGEGTPLNVLAKVLIEEELPTSGDAEYARSTALTPKDRTPI